ncbi:hypothetical protein [Methylobacterium sp. J-077]|uniref:hypothetical protein n=1 Tax=Methylobacterium sp. J-077 TaxID=2836656 RepID=UPI001FBA1A89|nr:hypothetical protein [Methylobacterium sp. J-077]MCJ2121777.1 hypothetical protein [Methylobacterium sp. J-077]
MIQEDPPPRRHASLSALRWRMRRGCLNAKRLEYEASVLASIYGAVRLGEDLELAGLLREVGLGEDAISALRFRQNSSEFGVILPTDHTWNQGRLKDRAIGVGLRESAVGRSVLIVPPAEVRLQPRLHNAKRIYHTKMVPACGDLETLTTCIDARGDGASLIDCEAALAGPHPRNRIFGLVYGGHFTMDLMAGITDQSVVRLRHPHPNWCWEALGWHPIHAV